VSELLSVVWLGDRADDAAPFMEELCGAGFEVTWELVGSASELQRRLGSRVFDLVLMDCSRLDAAERLAVQSDRLVDQLPPVIALADPEDESTAIEAMRHGARDYLLKGSLQRLTGAVRRELKDSRERKAARGRPAPDHDPRQVISGPGEGVCLRQSLLVAIEPREARVALTRSEAELAAVYEHAPIMMCLLDEDRRVRRLNRAGCELVGQPPDQVLGRRGGDILGCIHAADSPEGCGFGPECPQCALRLTVLDTLENGRSHHRVLAKPVLRRGSEPRRFVLLASTARVQVEGESLILLYLEDVTDQRLAEDQVREQAALLENAQDAIFVLDLDGVIHYWNQGAEHLYGWTAEEAGGCKVDALMFSEACPHWVQGWRVVQRDGHWVGELTQANRSRKKLTVQWRASLVRDPDGSPRSVLIVATDVTETRKLEAQFLRMQRMESLGALAGGVAHDLNNVLAPILMCLNLLRPALSRREDHEVLELIEASARRGAEIVRQLLFFGRGTEGRRTELHLKRLIQEIGHLVQETFPKSIQFTARVPGGLWPVWGDGTQIHQVLLNLCVNARDAMPKGGRLRITVQNIRLDAAVTRINPEAKPGAHLLLVVSDTGTGIPAGIRDRIFDPFFTTKETGRGSGLGLSTVLGIVRNHGGWVQVETREGQGTRFRVYLPASELDANQTVYFERKHIPQGQREMIMVVEDELAIRNVAARTLTRYGYRVLLARDGKEALESCVQHRGEIALVITDMVMPRLGGGDTIRGLRRIQPDVRLLGITGLLSHQAHPRHTDGPPVPILQKPFTAEQLVLAVQELLRPNGHPPTGGG